MPISATISAGSHWSREWWPRTFTPFTLGREANAQRVFGEVVSANYFAVFGVRPEFGRVFLPRRTATIGALSLSR